MYNGYKVVDVHGHMTTPAPFRQFLAETVAQNILWELRKFVGISKRTDDVTMIVVRVL